MTSPRYVPLRRMDTAGIQGTDHIASLEELLARGNEMVNASYLDECHYLDLPPRHPSVCILHQEECGDILADGGVEGYRYWVRIEMPKASE
jgi:hypothetical protein